MTRSSTPIPGEAVGPAFDPTALDRARAHSKRVVEAIAAAIRPGMREPEAEALAADLLRAHGAERLWHPTHIRFGPNTLKLYKERSEPDVVLGAEDLFFIDLGPVWDGHEGDYGDTFVLGAHPEHHAIAAAARRLYAEVAEHWRRSACSGMALYRYAEARAEEMGYVLNLGAPGHRLGDFPHSVHRAGKLADQDHTPSPARWVLEIQLRHPNLPIGAFYEDLLQ